MIQRLFKILSGMAAIFRKRKYRSAKAEFISSNAFFYKVLAKDKNDSNRSSLDSEPLKE